MPHGRETGITIRVDDVHLSLGDDPSLPVLAGVDLVAPAGELTAIIGPSGCGKSTLLDVIAGLIAPDAGAVTISGDGRTALMPQRDALMPWRTLRDNVAAAAEIAGTQRAAARDMAETELQRVGLAGFGDHYPHALSGGMRQRGALARTLLARRGAWLLDEPFGALDAITRGEMHRVLADVRSQVAPTILLVTHDIHEAAALADQVLVASPAPMRIVERVRVADAGPDPAGRILVALRDAGVAA